MNSLNYDYLNKRYDQMVLANRADGTPEKRHLHAVPAAHAGDQELQNRLDYFNRRFWEPQMFNRMLHACLNSRLKQIPFSGKRKGISLA